MALKKPVSSQVVIAMLSLMCGAGAASRCYASNHLDTPTVIANPQADIGDIYAWTSADGQRLNLVMDIVGHSFSNKLRYVFHIDSGNAFGRTSATTSIVCQFPVVNEVVTDIDCTVGDADVVSGDASDPRGLEGKNHKARVFAGLRDDPFFNNVTGTRAAYNVAFSALARGAAIDSAGCPQFDRRTSKAILDQWRHTEGGPATNFLARWTTSALVISVDLEAVSKGGKLLAVWGVTATADKQLDRVGRPLTSNALLGLNAPDEVADSLKERWNTLTPSESASFIPEIQRSLALYDGLDGVCGNQVLADSNAVPSKRYFALATLLSDDRLWVNTESRECTQFFAVELAQRAGKTALKHDCGGRTPLYPAANVWRSLLANGTTKGVDDGLDHDEHQPSATSFPFLAPPDPNAIDHYAEPGKPATTYKE
jgi:hypothetical protein